MSDMAINAIDLPLEQIGPTAETVAQIEQNLAGSATEPVAPPQVPVDTTPTPPAEQDPLAIQMQLDREASAQAQEAARQAARMDARNTINRVLNEYGLGELADFTYREIIAQDITDPDAIIFKLRDQPAYQRRFAGNATRAKKGLPELDPGSYIALENQYRETLRSNGLPANFYDQTEDFTALIEGMCRRLS